MPLAGILNWRHRVMRHEAAHAIVKTGLSNEPA